MTTRRTVLAGLTGLTASTAMGAGLSRAAAPVEVVATVAMIGDAVAAIGGDRVALTTLMGAGVDPHAYRQTRSDIAAMAGADLVLWNGLYLEAQLEEFLETLSDRVPVTAVAERGVPEEQRIAHEDYAGEFDPHVWMVPDLWRGAVAAVRDALVDIDPDGAVAYGEGHAAYDARLARLQSYAAETLATVPAERRVLITAHDAFGYFGRRYDFEVLGIQGLSTASEAGLKRIDDLVSLIVERQIGAVFVESSVSDRNVRALIEGAAAAGHEVKIGGQLFSDAMGVPGSYEGTYPGMIDHNATVIARALGGTAPERGLDGRLTPPTDAS
ncbi:MAG: zinc ABC transporter substrate-binding protein [Pseudomonadota bacterium]